MAQPMPTTIEATEAELAQLRAAIDADWQKPTSYGSLRGKQHGQRIDASVRRAGVTSARLTALEAHLAGLQRAAVAPAPKPLPTDDEILAARLVRTKLGWEQVVKVNRTTVTVVAEPGWDNKVPFRKILEVR